MEARIPKQRPVLNLVPKQDAYFVAPLPASSEQIIPPLNSANPNNIEGFLGVNRLVTEMRTDPGRKETLIFSALPAPQLYMQTETPLDVPIPKPKSRQFQTVVADDFTGIKYGERFVKGKKVGDVSSQRGYQGFERDKRTGSIKFHKGEKLKS